MLGADSTTTYGDPANGNHYYSHGQKLFEVGESGTLGVVVWGMGGLPDVSYRTLIAKLSDGLIANPVASVNDAALRWRDLFWAAYDQQPLVVEVRGLAARPPYDPSRAVPVANALTSDEADRLAALRLLLEVGFCIAGYVLPDRTPFAFSMVVRPLDPMPVPTSFQGWSFWGAPNMIQRLLFGVDSGITDAILASGKWNGTPKELGEIVAPHTLNHPVVPMREAVDFVYSCIQSTIKAMKFSNLPQICGGPVELAVITTDRKFRWVRHKPWDAAITEGELDEYRP